MSSLALTLDLEDELVVLLELPVEGYTGGGQRSRGSTNAEQVSGVQDPEVEVLVQGRPQHIHNKDDVRLGGVLQDRSIVLCLAEGETRVQRLFHLKVDPGLVGELAVGDGQVQGVARVHLHLVWVVDKQPTVELPDTKQVP